jgi:branched-chain amino acid transport system substrate-binding protein
MEKMMNTKRTLHFLLAGVLVLAACRRDETGAPQAGTKPTSGTTTVTIGAILPLTGENASFGTTQRAAFEIAQEDAKRQGRVLPRLVYGDSKLDKDLTLKEFRRLVDQEKVVAFAEVTGSGPALALEDIAAKDQVPIVSGIDTSPELTAGGGAYFFRVIPSDAYSLRVLSQWAFEKGLKKAALVVNQESDWAVGFKKAALADYRAKGGQLPDDAIVTVTNDTVNFAPAISRLKAQAPQAVFVGLMGRQAGLFVKQAVDKGLTGPFLGVDNLAQQEFSDNAGEARTRALLVLPSEVHSEAGRKFEAAYRAKTGREADAIAYKAYDSYITVLDAIEAVLKSGQPVTGKAVQKALVTLRFDGLTGPIAFDHDNDLAQANYERFTYDVKGTKVPAS